MRIITTLVFLGWVGLATTQAATRNDGGETAGATSLLTAERRAREAADWLRLPETGPARWKSGGTGWTPAWTGDHARPRDPGPR
jgi:hypothetical protein